MMKRKIKSVVCMLTVLVMVVSLAVGCGNGGGQKETGTNTEAAGTQAATTTEATLEMLEYSFAFYDDEANKWANNPNDVVTPYIEKKFQIKVKEVTVVKSEDFKQRLNQWIAADTIPDVICGGDTATNYAVSTGKFAQLDDYIKDMVNYNKYFDQKYWPRFMNDGKRYQIPNVTLNMNADQYKEDPYNPGDSAWAMWAREDILEQCGYKFVPTDDIKKNIIDAGKKPTLDDYKIEPAVDTPEKFYELLKKIKALNLSVGGKALLPISITSWQQFHIGSMFDFGHWRIDEQGNVDGYLGLPGAKPYYKFFNRLYTEGLIDKDFMIQKDDQLQEKVASGRVAVGMHVPDMAAAKESMANINPKAKIRYIPWPKETQGKGIFDIYQGGGWRYIISNNVKDIKRLTQYFDWFYSDEGLDLITWGPEEARLWEVKDGKKVFKDKEVEQACLNGEHGKKGADFYGLYDWANESRSPFWSKAAMATPIMTHGNPKSYLRSYPPKLDVLEVNKALCGGSGVDYKGIASSGDSGDNTNSSSGYFWNKFQNNAVAKLLVAKDDAEFDKAWDAIYNEFKNEGKYEAAKADMKKWFDTYGPK